MKRKDVEDIINNKRDDVEDVINNRREDFYYIMCFYF
jgi:hypothetical protein